MQRRHLERICLCITQPRFDTCVLRFGPTGMTYEHIKIEILSLDLLLPKGSFYLLILSEGLGEKDQSLLMNLVLVKNTRWAVTGAGVLLSTG